MKLGIALPQIGPALDGAGLVRFARQAEDLGYDSLWVGDRLITPLEPSDPYPGGQQPYPPQFTRAGDPVVVWAAAAAVTSRIRFNSSTLNAPYYAPVALARALTTLDVISDGRLDVGFATGWMRDEYAAAGVGWEDRGRRLDDLLSFLEAWWTANPVAYRSEWITLPESVVDLRPVQPGGPPVYLGGLSEAAVRRVGRRAAGWLPVDGVPDGVTASLWDVARRAAEEAGRDPDRLRRAVRINPAAGSTVDHLVGRLGHAAEVGMDEVFIDPFWAVDDVDRALELASTLVERRPA